MSTKYLARITEDGREQTLKNHLKGVAARCAAFCEPFGAKEQGFLRVLPMTCPNIRPRPKSVCGAAQRWIILLGAAWFCWKEDKSRLLMP